MSPRSIAAAALLVVASLGACSSQPPAHDVVLHPADSTVTAIIEHPDYDWLQIRTPHTTVYYESGSFTESYLETLMALVEASVDRALDVLDEPSAARGIRVFMVDRREQMKAFVGSTPKGYTLVGHDAVLLVYNDGVRPYAQHEIFHAISIELWGFPSPWIREGGAVFADGSCLDYEDPLHTIAAYLARTGQLLPLATLIDEFMTAAAENDLIAYLQAASFFQYLYETYGVQAVKRLWQSEPFQDGDIEGRPIRAWVGEGAVSVEAAVGEPVDKLEADWLEYIAQPRFEHEVDWEELMEKGCG